MLRTALVEFGVILCIFGLHGWELITFYIHNSQNLARLFRTLLILQEVHCSHFVICQSSIYWLTGYSIYMRGLRRGIFCPNALPPNTVRGPILLRSGWLGFLVIWTALKTILGSYESPECPLSNEVWKLALLQKMTENHPKL